MARFEPQVNENVRLDVDGASRWFAPVEHPNAASMVHAMEGGKALVYRLRDLQDGSEYALKVMKPRHRDSGLTDICAFLDRLKTRPGLAVCERLCLTPARAAKTLGEYPSLEYAILMPWISGNSWFDVLQRRDALGKDECLQLATHLADVLASLEAAGLSHCDLSSGNLLFDPATLTVELIDVEDLYSQEAPRPKALPAGTAGYQHRTSAKGQWSPAADRFAGAVLLSEILGWYDPAVRSASYGDSFFDPGEVQQNGSARFTGLSGAVRRQRARLGDLLERAWRSMEMDECPPLGEWSQACRISVGWKPLPAVPPATIGTAVKPFWRPISAPSGPREPEVQWKSGLAVPPAQGPTATWKGGTGGGR
jgi:hypothetical protein